MFLFPSWERPVVGNLSDIVGPNWELGPNRSATLTGSVGVMGVWEPKKLAWEARSQKNGWILVQKAGTPKLVKSSSSSPLPTVSWESWESSALVALLDWGRLGVLGVLFKYLYSRVLPVDKVIMPYRVNFATLRPLRAVKPPFSRAHVL